MLVALCPLSWLCVPRAREQHTFLRLSLAVPTQEVLREQRPAAVPKALARQQPVAKALLETTGDIC